MDGVDGMGLKLAKLPSVQTLARFGEYFYLRAWLVFGVRMVCSVDLIALRIINTDDILAADEYDKRKKKK